MPVATDIVERKVTDGVLDKATIIAQTKAALNILEIARPDRIVTLGGECSASVVPFTYLADKYEGRRGDGVDLTPILTLRFRVTPTRAITPWP